MVMSVFLLFLCCIVIANKCLVSILIIVFYLSVCEIVTHSDLNKHLTNKLRYEL